jgi:hypothetical protein
VTTATWSFVAGGVLVVAAAVVLLCRPLGRVHLTGLQTRMALGVLVIGIGVVLFTFSFVQEEWRFPLRGIGQGLGIGGAILLLNNLAEWIRQRRQRDRSG